MYDGPIPRFRILLTLGVTVILGFSAQSVDAQTWSKKFWIDDPLYPYEMSADTMSSAGDGGMFIAGGYGRTALTKLDPFGNVSWSQWIGGSLLENERMIKTRNGELVIADVTPYSWPDRWVHGYWLTRFGADGSVKWHKQYGDPDFPGSSGAIGAIVETADEGLLVATSGGWLAKTDSDGNIQWQKQYPDPAAFRPSFFGVAVLPSGNIVVAGHWANQPWGSDGTEEGALWVLFLNSQGNIISQRLYGSSAWEGGGRPFVTPDGGVVIVGPTNRYNSWPGGAIWFLKFSGLGVLEWEKAFAYSGSVFLTLDDVVRAGTGDLIARGRSDYLNPGTDEPAILRFSMAGSLLWIKDNGWIGVEDFKYLGNSAEVTDTGNIVTSARTDSPAGPSSAAWLVQTDGAGEIHGQCTVSDLPVPSVFSPVSFVATTNAVAEDANYTTTSYDPMPEPAVVLSEDICIPDSPRVEALPWPMDFGVVDVDSTQVLQIEIRNTGALGMWVSAMNVSPPFVLTTSCAGMSVAPAASCTAELRFGPPATGEFFGELTVETDDPATPVLVAPVRGKGIDMIFNSNFETGNTSSWSSTVP